MTKYLYLDDTSFLKAFDKERLKEQYVKIVILDKFENPIEDIEGKVLGGNISIDGSSSIRRTANISLIPFDQNRIESTQSLFSISKRVRIEIGFKNNTTKYLENKFIWFPMGTYVITGASISNSLSGLTVNLQLKDKMALLNGECGGVLPAAVVFSEIDRVDTNGEWVTEHPTIYQIIKEVVNHWGGEQLGKIIISDVDERIRRVMKWYGDTPVYAFNNGNGIEFTTNEGRIKELISQGFIRVSVPEGLRATSSYMKYERNSNIGFIYTDFIYAGGELVGEAGSTVCDVLDKIKDCLGNYEYFYDIDGNFIFREIKNYLNNPKSMSVLKDLEDSKYIVDNVNNKSIYNFNDSTLVSSYNNSPQYNMIKNHFVVWGERKGLDDNKFSIRYHLVIDDKPTIGNEYQVFKYLDPYDDIEKAKSAINVETFSSIPTEGNVTQLYYTKDTNKFYKWNSETLVYEEMPDATYTNVTTKDWRSELYLQGVISEPLAIESNAYYPELASEWVKLYDVWEGEFKDEVLQDPSSIDFFIDFIDSGAEVAELSVSEIGRRTKVVVDNKINCIFEPEIPELVILEEGNPNLAKERAECEAKGETYTQVDQGIFSNMAFGGGFNAAYDLVRELLYQYTSYNNSISLQTIPIYYLDVNSRVSVYDEDSGINGDYIIRTISIPLDVSSSMSISATKALERL